MIIIPAIDIMNGKVVRLFKGEYDKQTVYSDDPLEVARAWQEQGAELIHMVDLDGAQAGFPVNIDLIGSVIKGIDIPVQIGGGLRTMDDLEQAFDKGVAKAVIGSAAFMDKDFLTKATGSHSDKIAVSIDTRDGLVACHGWTSTTSITAKNAAREMEQTGVKTVIFTDINTDGTLCGPNLGQLSEILRSVSISVIASGGVSSLDDILHLRSLPPRPPYGVVIGLALYEKKVDLKKAIKIVK